MSGETFAMADPASAIIAMLTEDQHEALTGQSLYAVPFPADNAAGSLSAAIARLLDIFPPSLAAGDDLPARAAAAYAVRLMVMGAPSGNSGRNYPDSRAGAVDGQWAGDQSPSGSVVCPTSIR